jgi:hypothetical protein
MKKYVLIFLIIACAACTPLTLLPPTSTLPPPATLRTPILELTPTNPAGLPFDPSLMRSADCMEPYTAKLPIKELQGLSNEEIITHLFENYLSHYKIPDRGAMCRLIDFDIVSVTHEVNLDFLAKEQNVDFVDGVVYSVQMPVLPSDWVAGNGEFGENGWIIHKFMISGAVKVDDEYVLKLIGTGP